MSHSDPIADLLTRIRNGVSASNKFVDIPLSRNKLDVLLVLEKEGFIEHILVDKEKRKMRVFLKYGVEGDPVIRSLVRISKPSLRKYVGYRSIPKIYNGLGLAVVSTPNGVMSGEDAKQHRLGGELLCSVW